VKEGRKEGRRRRRRRRREIRRGGLGERVLLFFAGAADHHPVLQN